MKSDVIVLDRGNLSEGAYQGPKQSPMNSHNDRKIDGGKLLLSLLTTLKNIFNAF